MGCATSTQTPAAAARRKPDRTLTDYLEGSPNILRLSVPAQRDAAIRVLHGEIKRNEVEFFCGSGVGRAATGVSWVGLLNLGARRIFKALRPAEASNVNGPPLSELASRELALVDEFYQAFGPNAEAGHKQALIKKHGDWLSAVQSYAAAVDGCLSAASGDGAPCPKSYNVFISELTTRLPRRSWR